MKIQYAEQVLDRRIRAADGPLGRVVGIVRSADPYEVVWFVVRLTGLGRKRLRAVPASHVETSEPGELLVPVGSQSVLASPRLDVTTPTLGSLYDVESFCAEVAS
jgi:hypothetical protein